jgi:hypothetical protein
MEWGHGDKTGRGRGRQPLTHPQETDRCRGAHPGADLPRPGCYRERGSIPGQAVGPGPPGQHCPGMALSRPVSCGCPGGLLRTAWRRNRSGSRPISLVCRTILAAHPILARGASQFQALAPPRFRRGHRCGFRETKALRRGCRIFLALAEWSEQNRLGCKCRRSGAERSRYANSTTALGPSRRLQWPPTA